MKLKSQKKFADNGLPGWARRSDLYKEYFSQKGFKPLDAVMNLLLKHEVKGYSFFGQDPAGDIYPVIFLKEKVAVVLWQQDSMAMHVTDRPDINAIVFLDERRTHCRKGWEVLPETVLHFRKLIPPSPPPIEKPPTVKPPPKQEGPNRAQRRMRRREDKRIIRETIRENLKAFAGPVTRLPLIKEPVETPVAAEPLPAAILSPTAPKVIIRKKA